MRLRRSLYGTSMPGAGAVHHINSGLMRRSKRAVLFDNLVSAGEHGGRHVEAEGPRGLEVDSHLKFGRELNRQVAWHRTTKNTIHVSSGTPQYIYWVCYEVQHASVFL